MVIYLEVSTASTVRADVVNCDVESTVSEYGVSSHFYASLPNYYGRHKSDFTIGDEVTIKTGTATPPATTIFVGIIENVDFEGADFEETVKISGRDYTARLMDETVKPEVYTDQAIETIVRDIFDKYTTTITRTGVTATGKNLRRITFNQVTVYEAYKRLAELAGFIFYVDTAKDLVFKKKASASSGVTLNNTNVADARFKTTRDGMYNKIFIYGDRYLTAAPRHNFTPSGGSVFQTSRKPHNVRVDYLGSVKIGGVFNFAVDPGSSQYLVDFHSRNIIFTSGAQAGNNVPGSNVGSIIIDYDSDFPIVKYGESRESIRLYGPCTKVIYDRTIKDPRQAEDRLIKELELLKEPPVRGELLVRGTATVTPGDTILVNLPNFNVSSVTYEILAARWEFNKPNMLSERVLTITVNKRVQEITDKMVQAWQELRELKAGDLTPEDLITRYEYAAGSARIIGSWWEVRTRTLGSSFVLNHPVNGKLGSPAAVQGGTAQVTLGDTRSAFTVQRSGGEI